MNRKHALLGMASLAGGIGVASTFLTASASGANPPGAAAPQRGKALKPPANGPVRVGIIIGPSLVAIDAFGPYAAFRAANVAADRAQSSPLFDFFLVAKTTDPIDIDGLQLKPQYSFDDAPQPQVIVVPNQQPFPETVAYVKRASRRADVTMAVCTGAFIVAQAGLFNGLRATTHHLAYDVFAQSYPRVTLLRGPKYVEEPNVSSSGGETSGVDLALRVVERYYGADTARQAAYMMEYRRIDRPQNAAEV
ncbi:MAG TPA: DJ-1/PfpI family protein [Candidatus Eremiobacteraceae bacterium]|nr:DJ-1/PfpI family protein [Candidatus Eremiobacteraceae bacterium]